MRSIATGLAILASLLAVFLWTGTIFSQTGRGSVPANAGSANAAGNSTIGTEGASLAAPVPQYWLADASIFIASGVNTAAVMEAESHLNVQAPSIIGSQAQFLIEASNRALADLNSLEQNALDTNPRSVPAIRNAIAQLVAAQAQATRVVKTAKNGQLGPTYQKSISSTVEHLRIAEKAIVAVGENYGVPQFASAVRAGAGMGGRGFAGGGAGSMGGGGEADFGGGTGGTAGFGGGAGGGAGGR